MKTFTRLFALASLLLSVTSPLGLQAAGSTPILEKIYVGQRGLANIAVIRGDTLVPATTSPIALGAGAVPQELLADPARPYLYVADSGLSSVHVINTVADALEYSVPVTAGPQALALSPDGHSLYVTTATKVERIDTRSRVVVASTTFSGFSPWDIAVSLDGSRVWVTSGTSSAPSPIVKTLDPSTLVETKSRAFSAASARGIVAGASTELNVTYFADTTGHAEWGFDDTTGSLSSYSPVAYAFPSGPWALERQPFAPGRLLATDGAGSATLGGDTLVEIDTAGQTATRTLTSLGASAGADSPTEIAFSGQKPSAYVTLRASNKVSVVDYTSTGALIESGVVSLSAGADPYGIEVAPAQHAAIRLAGSDRYDTAVKVSAERFANKGADAMVVTRGDDFPDALAAGSLTGLLKGPLFLTKKESVPDSIKTEIKRVFDDVEDPEADVIAVGGTAVVSDAVLSTIEGLSSKLDVVRVAGADRIETAIKVGEYMDTFRGSKSTTVFLARDNDYPDALTASALGANPAFHPTAAPVLLTGSAALDSRVKTYLTSLGSSLVQVYLMGGTSALSSEVATEVTGLGVTTTRLGGANRYASAITAAKFFFPTGPSRVLAALGTNFPDALVAAPFAGHVDLSGVTPTYSMPIVLIKSTSVPTETSDYLSSVSGTVASAFIAGGTTAVTTDTESVFNSLY